MRQHIKDYGIVEKVELKEVTFTDGSPTTKYMVTLSKDFNGRWLQGVILYTNNLYTIGDTIQVVRRTNP
jgi:hypothetical protein